MVTTSPEIDEISDAVLTAYTSLHPRIPEGQWTILAGFVLSRTSRDNMSTDRHKVISLGTGVKCLPAERLPSAGDTLHDSHAEVLARRGAIRWFLEELSRDGSSTWIQKASGENLRARLQPDTTVSLYVSMLPCGDASASALAARQLLQDPEMAALKDATIWSTLPPGATARGRDNYALKGVLRTKPGRADSPPTACMSCSDKIAFWNAVGFQGALLAQFLAEPLYIERIVVGDVPLDLQLAVHGDCERAFWSRLGGCETLSPPFVVHRPKIYFTSHRFIHSQLSINTTSTGGSCNESLCWFADSIEKPEILINGLRRGVAPKHRANPKFLPLLCKRSLFILYRFVVQSQTTGENLSKNMTLSYGKTKQLATGYQHAKQVMYGTNGPFSGWVKSSTFRLNLEDFEIE